MAIVLCWFHGCRLALSHHIKGRVLYIRYHPNITLSFHVQSHSPIKHSDNFTQNSNEAIKAGGAFEVQWSVSWQNIKYNLVLWSATGCFPLWEIHTKRVSWDGFRCLFLIYKSLNHPHSVSLKSVQCDYISPSIASRKALCVLLKECCVIGFQR